jgi:hypothetical protein
LFDVTKHEIISTILYFSTSIAGSDVIYFVHNSLHFLCANSFKNDYFIKKLENATNITLPEQAEQ